MENDKFDLDNLSNNQLIELKKNTEKTKWEHYNKFKELDEYIKHLDSIIFKQCGHEWVMDYSATSPYDGPDRICKKCNLYNNKYMYETHS